MPQNPHNQATTNGPISAVPCPWCNRPNNFRELEMSSGPPEKGDVVGCDHCTKSIEVVQTRVPPTIIVVKQYHGAPITED